MVEGLVCTHCKKLTKKCLNLYQFAGWPQITWKKGLCKSNNKSFQRNVDSAWGLLPPAFLPPTQLHCYIVVAVVRLVVVVVMVAVVLVVYRHFDTIMLTNLQVCMLKPPANIARTWRGCCPVTLLYYVLSSATSGMVAPLTNCTTVYRNRTPHQTLSHPPPPLPEGTILLRLSNSANAQVFAYSDDCLVKSLEVRHSSLLTHGRRNICDFVNFFFALRVCGRKQMRKNLDSLW